MPWQLIGYFANVTVPVNTLPSGQSTVPIAAILSWEKKDRRPRSTLSDELIRGLQFNERRLDTR
jgi:hypothetical protein